MERAVVLHQWELLLLLLQAAQESLGVEAAIAVQVGHLDIADPVAYPEPGKTCSFSLIYTYAFFPADCNVFWAGYLRVLRVLATTDADSGNSGDSAYSGWVARLGLESHSTRVLGILGLLAPLLLAWNTWYSPSPLSTPLTSTKLPAGGLPLLLLLLLLLAPLLSPLLLDRRPWVEAPLLAPPGFLNFLSCRYAKMLLDY